MMDDEHQTPLTETWLQRVCANVDSLPVWARPPFYGALFVLLIVGARAGLLLPLILVWALVADGIGGLLDVLWIGVVAALAGFAGGSAYSVGRFALGSVSWPARYLPWWLAVAAYASVIMPMLSSTDPQSKHYWSVRDPVGWVIIAAMSILFGSIIARGMSGTAQKPKRKWVQRKQQVTSRVHPPAS